MRRARIALLLALLLAAGMAQAQPSAATEPELLRSARIWQVKGRADLARSALEKMLRARPDDAEGLLQLGLLEIVSARYPRAEALLASLRQQHPGAFQTEELDQALRAATVDRIQLATLRKLRQGGQRAAVLELLKQIFPQGAPHGELGIEYCRGIALDDARWAEARTGYERLIREHPDDPRYRLALARHLLRQPQTRVAALDQIEVLAQQPDVSEWDARELWLNGLDDLPAGADTVARIRRYLVLVPNDSKALQLLAVKSQTGAAAAAQRDKPAETLAPTQAAATPKPRPKPGAAEMEARSEHEPSPARAAPPAVIVAAAPPSPPPPPPPQPSPREIAIARWHDAALAAQSRSELPKAEALQEAAAGFETGNFYRVSLAARQLAQTGDTATAEALYEQVLTLDAGNATAFMDRLRLWAASGRRDQAEAALVAARHAGAPPPATLDSLEAELLADDAEAALAQQQPALARDRLERAQPLSPRDPWLAYRLARLRLQAGNSSDATMLMDKLARTAPRDADTRHAQALLLWQAGDESAAMSALLSVPEDQRTPAMRRLGNQLQIAPLRRDAARLTAAGDTANALASLQQARAIAADDPQLLAEVAGSAATLGRGDIALAWMRAAADAAPAPAIEPRLSWADLAADLHDDTAVDKALSPLRGLPIADADQSSLYANLETGLARRKAAAQASSGQTDAALQALEQARARLPDDRRIRLQQAELLLAAGRSDEAAQRYAELHAQTPQDASLQLDYARALRKAGRSRAARREIDALAQATPAADADLRLDLAAEYRALGLPDQAAQLYTEQKRAAPDSEAGKTAQFRLASLDAARPGSAAIGAIVEHKAGSAGISNLDHVELPAELRVPLGYWGQLFARADMLRLSAGRLPADYDHAAVFGSVQAAGPAALAAFADGVDIQASGVALGVGLETEHWRADIGHTPTAFPVNYLLGGLRYDGRLGGSDLRVEVSQRAVTSSLLSYAGARDPASGRIWGGVRAAGAHAQLDQQNGRLGLFASLGLDRYRGENVADNASLKLRLAGDWKLRDQPGDTLYAGLAASYWHYQHNLRYYSFGHGGYYSPQSYLSLSAPLDWRGRVDRWSYQLRASPSYSWSHEDREPFYPDDAALQTAALSSPLPSGYDAPYYDGGNGGGFGYSLSAALGYQLTPHWSAGARAAIDRSDYYEPNLFYLVLRYRFEATDEAPDYPPRMLYPYADF
ncbi:MAG: tetratricopeptide repeat protein [Hydrocarboniphaga sp.]|uniref:cellulose biosynthesis protein BcsC n=1 Tax=Hydrocarboniphaga sp. TaxID=2033016 RepID=UPI00262F4BFB|nr:cellulose biosynthesis protein BcsC [Hydrocarboniphaga sp.]MDB5969534.1 tetratricopeptide repeat protein [Hydrocarboniphaga sp.]